MHFGSGNIVFSGRSARLHMLLVKSAITVISTAHGLLISSILVTHSYVTNDNTLAKETFTSPLQKHEQREKKKSYQKRQLHCFLRHTRTQKRKGNCKGFCVTH